jgi:hypothetical protein
MVTKNTTARIDKTSTGIPDSVFTTALIRVTAIYITPDS